MEQFEDRRVLAVAVDDERSIAENETLVVSGNGGAWSNDDYNAWWSDDYCTTNLEWVPEYDENNVEIGGSYTLPGVE